MDITTALKSLSVALATSHKEVEPAPWITKVNNTLLDFLGAHPKQLDLGPSFSDLSYTHAVTALQLYRMHKKFEKPNDSNAKERKERSLLAAITSDASGIEEFFVPGSARIDPYVRHQLYTIRLKLHEVINRYRFCPANLEFPSGETYVSASGDISLYAKLRDIEQWTCTDECFEMFARIAYNTPMLKYAARRHFSSLKRSLNTKTIWLRALRLSDGNVHKARFLIFREMLRQVVTFVPGGRFTTVPKSVEVDRVIICEPFCNMIAQRTIEMDVRRIIKEVYDIDLDTSQVLHKLLLSDSDNVTIDLKNASNSVFTAVIDWFMRGTLLHTHLMQSRSEFVSYGKDEWHKMTMLSAMGNGYTFGVMTLLLLVITREFDSFAHVFGDDIIVHKDVASDVVTFLANIGFATNESKTFLQGSFRESCGGFTVDGKYITSFEIEWAEDAVDAVVLINKVGIMAHATPSKLRKHLLKLHRDLLDLVPEAMLRPTIFRQDFAGRKVQCELMQLKRELAKDSIALNHLSGTYDYFVNDHFSLTEGVYCPPVYYREKQTLSSKKRIRKYLSNSDVKDLQLGGEQIVAYLHLSKKNDVYRTKSGKELKPVHNVSRLFGWYYIWAGKAQAPALRDIYVSEKWVLNAPRVL